MSSSGLLEKTSNMDINEIRKDLYKSKEDAHFSHYCAGSLYYNVKLSDGTYQFPVATTEEFNLRQEVSTAIDPSGNLGHIDHSTTTTEVDTLQTEEKINVNAELHDTNMIVRVVTDSVQSRLSSDLGTTSFDADIKASFLVRWIAKALKTESFVKISNVEHAKQTA